MKDIYPPIANIFQFLELPTLSEEDSELMFRKALKSISLHYKEDALEMMVKHSGDFPLLLHEIGEAVYWCDKDGILDKKDVIDGLIVAADSLGSKQFRHLLYKRIRNPVYRKILFQLAKMPSQTIITTKLLQSFFSNPKKDKMSAFVKRMVFLNVFKHVAPGSYRFSSELLRLYLLLEYIKES